MPRTAIHATYEMGFCPVCVEGVEGVCDERCEFRAPTGRPGNRGYPTVALDANPEMRLAVLARDPNLMHSGARWAAHEVVYPCSGASGILPRYFTSDEVLRQRFEASLAELEAKAPDDEALGYVRWLIAELEAVKP